MLIDHTWSWLAPRLAKSPKNVRIVTPWLSRAPVEQILGTLDPDATLHVLFRWPHTGGDLLPMDLDGLQRLLDEARDRPDQVAVEHLRRPALHAKVYAVDKDVLVTSANATAAGLGLDPARANRELGLTRRGRESAEVLAWLDALEDEAHPLTPEELRALRAWKGRLLAQPAGVAISEPLGHLDRASLVADVMERARASGALRAFERQPLRGNQAKGLHFTFHVRTATKGHLTTSKAITSEGEGAAFHFNLRRPYLELYRARHLKALLYVPARRVPTDRGWRLVSPDDAPHLVVVPLDRLFHLQKGLTRGATGRVKVMLRATVAPWDGGWVLLVHCRDGRHRQPAAFQLQPLTKRGGHTWLELPRKAWLDRDEAEEIRDHLLAASEDRQSGAA